MTGEPLKVGAEQLRDAWNECSMRWHEHLAKCRECGFESNFCPEGKRLFSESKKAYQSLKQSEGNA